MEAARAWQEIAQVQRVEAAHGRRREQGLQQRAAAGGQLVQRERSATRLREDGDEAMTPPTASSTRSPGRTCAARTAIAPRCGGVGELVEEDLLFAAPRVGQPEIGKVREEGGDLGRRIFKASQLGRESPDLQDERGFDRIVGVPPEPGPVGVRPPEGRGHDAAHEPAVERS